MLSLVKHRKPWVKKKKLLKAAATRQLSLGETSKRLITQFCFLIDALDTIFEKGAEQEVKGVCDELLQSDAILFLLLLSDFLPHNKKFLLFLQRKNLILGELGSKFTRLKRSIDELENKDGQLFRQHSR